MLGAVEPSHSGIRHRSAPTVVTLDNHETFFWSAVVDDRRHDAAMTLGRTSLLAQRGQSSFAVGCPSRLPRVEAW